MQKETLSLEPNPDLQKELFYAVQQYTNDFLSELPEKKAFFSEKADNASNDPDFRISGEPHSIGNVLKTIENKVDKTGINAASGGHLGYIPGGGIYSAALGDYIAAVTNRYAGVFYASPGAVRIENALIDWSAKLIGYENNYGGNLTSGGSIANLIALSAAKTARNIRSKNVEKAVIYATSQNHHSILKALRLIGLDECIFRTVPLDERYRMRTDELEKQLIADKKNKLQPFLIIANAGSTDVGAIDPLSEIARIAQRENTWLHVDAAYGGFFMLTNDGKQKLKGLEKADSVILDPHKSLFLPYGSGMVLVKDVKHLLSANSYEANYMQDTQDWDQELSPAELSPELSKHFRGMRMWLPLQIHGTKPFEDCLNEKLELTRYFCEEVQKLGFELGNDPELTVAIYRYNPANANREDFNRALLRSVHKDGRVFISSTELNGEFWLRIAILSFRTHKREVDILLELLGSFIRSNA